LGKRLSRKSNNVIVFPFAFHIAVQQLFKPFWSHQLLYNLESSIICSAPQVITDDAASGIRGILSKFPSSRYLSSSGSYPLDVSSLGDLAGSNDTAGLALRITGTHKPLHHNTAEIPSEGILTIMV